MKGELRRKEILKKLTFAKEPISAKTLAAAMGVSRQAIVQDIALLRASGEEICSLARGYQLESKRYVERVFKTVHSDADSETELNLIVDLGGTVSDVFIYHKVYGIVKAKLDIRNRHDVQKFMQGITTGKSSLLKNVTAGYHYHTVLAKNEETLDLIEGGLREHGFLAPLLAFEPSELNR